MNDIKLWPTGDSWATVGTECTPINKLTVPALEEIAVCKGDKLRFVVNAGTNANYDDRVQWPVTVNFKERAFDLVLYGAPVSLLNSENVGDTSGIGERWVYEVSSNKSLEYEEMWDNTYHTPVVESDIFIDTLNSGAKLETLWNNRSLYMNVGWYAGSRDISQTFIVPENGFLSTDSAEIVRHYGLEDTFEQSVDVAMYLNETKLWPTGDSWASVGTECTPINKLIVPALEEIAVKKGDRLRFVVNAGVNANYDDRVQWPVTVNMRAPNSSGALLNVPDFFEEYSELKNGDYAIDLRLPSGEWQPITPYTVKNNFGTSQNLTAADPVRECPMISFEMGTDPIEVRIEKIGEAIQSAQIHPTAFSYPTRIENGKAYVTVNEPANLTVEINGDRYEKVYIFANPYDPNKPLTSNESVRLFGTGLTELPKVGTNVWKGALSDVRIYDRALSTTEVQCLFNGENIGNPQYHWELTSGFVRTNGISSTLCGSPVIQSYEGRIAAVFNGFEDAVQTDVTLDMSEDFSISAWVYLDPSGESAKRTILHGLLFVRSDGTIGSDIGDWQFPYSSSNIVVSGTWQHITLSKQQNTVTAYINGLSGGTETRPTASGTLGITLGSAALLNGAYLRDGQTFYLEPGAVVRGTLFAYGVKNVAIKGFGMIDVSLSNSMYYVNGILCAFSDTVAIEGVTVNNPSSFNLSLGQSRNVKVNNFKCFSSYGASDGINTKACENVRIENSFIVSNDDALSVYASSVDYLGSTRYYSAINNILTSGIHMAIHGQEYGNDEVSKIRVEKLHILNNATQVSNEFYQGLLSVNAGNDVAAYDITFDTVFIENIKNNQLFNVRVFMNPNYNKTPGKIVEDVRYKNIYYEGDEATVMPSVISGSSDDRCVKNVVFENVQLNKIRLSENDLIVGQYVQDVLIR